MVQAIGSSTSAGAAVSSPPIGGLDAQLARYQKELSECVNCESAKTPEGKKTIQAVSDKISVVKARLEEVVTGKSNSQSVKQEPSSAKATAAPSSAKAAVGSAVDVFA
jgi:hypothetical protein